MKKRVFYPDCKFGSIFIALGLALYPNLTTASPPEFVQLPRDSSMQLPIVRGKAALMVAGGPFSKRFIFERGEAPNFSRMVFKGFPDGVYQFEFRELPLDRFKRDALPSVNSIRYGTDRVPSSGVRIISGSVTIQNGYAE